VLSEPVTLAIIAAVATVLSGIFLKVLDHMLNKKKRQLDELTLIRNELRTDLTSSRKETQDLRKELDAMENQMDSLKGMYWLLYADFQRYKVAHPDITPPNPP
jgi:septal ring factor EnvC (AmiA/AmiB activator)